MLVLGGLDPSPRPAPVTRPSRSPTCCRPRPTAAAPARLVAAASHVVAGGVLVAVTRLITAAVNTCPATEKTPTTSTPCTRTVMVEAQMKPMPQRPPR